ncbi:MarR family winged helix-turn-helix transcriptional regulator [Sphingomonas sp.]|uniref:MarR family winged helix-turn-helix transcriptional regulator n=1 Tax=Sphingomonas sp. TaxID=28214 RepID=UPI003D6D2B18
MGKTSNIRQMPPIAVLRESPDRLGLRITMVQIAVYSHLAPELAELGLTSPSRLTALNHINANPGCNQSDLATFTGLSRASVKTMIDQLEHAGLVDRLGSEDARMNALHLTGQGRVALASALERTAINEEKIFGELSPAEQATLKQLLEKVIRHAAELDRSTS